MKYLICSKKYLLILFVQMSLHSFSQSQPNDPKATEVWEPKPKIVTPGKLCAEPPADAIILFDGSNLNEWQNPQFKGEAGTIEGIEKILKEWDENFKHIDAGWNIANKELIVKPGNGAIETKKRFSNFQLHIEWLSPDAVGKQGQGYSNSGIFLMSLYELQVLNSYDNQTYSNGQAGSIYKQAIPSANASRPPGEWQVYDVAFSAPVFGEKGELVYPARVTVFHNGVLIHNNIELKGPTCFIGQTKPLVHPAKMPIRLQDHGDPVKFRNIWIREL
ncbi:MAG TPA: DUF1080 domain-containing protein [Cytophagales bacterium]|jgi:hypothetical protein|nr:DUF1080 domain-containing protein [Cytophagales bacterium]